MWCNVNCDRGESSVEVIETKLYEPKGDWHEMRYVNGARLTTESRLEQFVMEHWKQ